jgi:hypothetical protein
MPPPNDFLQLAERRSRSFDARNYSLEVVPRSSVVVVPETKAGREDVSFDRLERLPNEVAQEGRSFGANILQVRGRWPMRGRR